jgi:DNA invertase Pin-like site-specific DNA recombinase
MSTSTPTAFSYVRFSSKRQEEGDSIRRQTEAARGWADRNKVPLDTSLKIDRGVSAFKGKNADLGSLGEFLRLVEKGRVRRGDYLVVENLDRISRVEVQPALRLILGILAGGVRIVQLTPAEMVYDDKSDTFSLIIMTAELSRAHGESAVKSKRVGDAREAERRRMRETGEVVTRRLPAWVEEVGGRPALIPERAAVVKRIFRLAGTGYGVPSIVALFEKEGVPAFGSTGRWTRSYVGLILTDKRALGELQPLKGAAPDGPPIPDFFPAVVTPKEFRDARAGARQRRPKAARGGAGKGAAVRDAFEALGPRARAREVVAWCRKHRRVEVGGTSVWRGRRKLLRPEGALGPAPANGSRGVGPVNVFAGLLKHARDGDSYIMTPRHSHSPGRPSRRFQVLINSRSQQGGSRCYSVPYDVFENAVLGKLAEIGTADILPEAAGAGGPDRVLALTKERAGVEAELADANAFMDEHGFSPSVGKRVKALEDRLADLARELAEAEREADNPAPKRLGEAQCLAAALAGSPDPRGARRRLRSLLVDLASEVVLLVEPRGRDRHCLVQIWFADGGRHRDYYLFVRPASGRRRACWRCWSFVTTGPFDLREPAGEKPLERALNMMDWLATFAFSPGSSSDGPLGPDESLRLFFEALREATPPGCAPACLDPSR